MYILILLHSTASSEISLLFHFSKCFYFILPGLDQVSLLQSYLTTCLIFFFKQLSICLSTLTSEINWLMPLFPTGIWLHESRNWIHSFLWISASSEVQRTVSAQEIPEVGMHTSPHRVFINVHAHCCHTKIYVYQSQHLHLPRNTARKLWLGN